MCPRVSFWSLIPDLPGQFGAVLILVAFAILLAPYMAGADFGPVKIPDLKSSVKQRIKIIGPVAFIGALLLFIPIFSEGTLTPTHKVNTTAGLINLRVAPLTKAEVDAGAEESRRTGVPHETIMMPLYNGTEVKLVQQVDESWFLVRVQKGCAVHEGVIATTWNKVPTIQLIKQN